MGLSSEEFLLPEGATPLDADEAADLIPAHITTVGQLNEWEQTNILLAENWLFERKRSGILSEPFVRELHRRMFGQTWMWAGKYRATAKDIGVPASQIPSDVKNTCDDASFQVANGAFDLDETAVRLHHRMAYIHPFPNGNGRHARLLGDALLFAHDRERLTWGSADLQVPGEARAAYLDALRRADKGEYRPLIEFARR